MALFGTSRVKSPTTPKIAHYRPLFGDENTVQATALRGPRGSPARKTYHLEGNCKFRRTRVSTSASYDPPKTTSPRLMRLHEPLGPPYTKKSVFFNERILINGRRRLSKHAPRHLPPIFFFNRARFAENEPIWYLSSRY